MAYGSKMYSTSRGTARPRNTYGKYGAKSPKGEFTPKGGTRSASVPGKGRKQTPIHGGRANGAARY